MTKGGRFYTATFVALIGLIGVSGKASAAQCGSTAAGFEAWKAAVRRRSEGKGRERFSSRSFRGDQLCDRDHRS